MNYYLKDCNKNLKKLCKNNDYDKNLKYEY